MFLSKKQIPETKNYLLKIKNTNLAMYHMKLTLLIPAYITSYLDNMYLEINIHQIY